MGQKVKINGERDLIKRGNSQQKKREDTEEERVQEDESRQDLAQKLRG